MEWFENEDLWRELYPYVFPLERLAAAAGQVSGIIELTGVRGGTVLDLCCGPGRHSVEFARRGFTVTGVDRSSFLLERAQEKATSAEVTVEWVLHDMRQFRRPAQFDLVCNLFTSFGYFQREEDNLAVLRNIRESLRPAGVLVMDMVGRELMDRQGCEPRQTHFADGAVLIQQPHLNPDSTRLDNDWTLVKGGQSRSYRFEHRLYSGQALEDCLRSCGFSDVQLYGDLQGAPYLQPAQRLVAVARPRSVESPQ